MGDIAPGMEERSILLAHPDDAVLRRLEAFIMAHGAALACQWGWWPARVDSAPSLAGRSVGPEVGLIVVHLHRPVGGSDEIERIWALRAVERCSAGLVGLTFERRSPHGVFGRLGHTLVQYPIEISSLLETLLAARSLVPDRVVQFTNEHFALGEGLCGFINRVEANAGHAIVGRCSWDAVGSGIAVLSDQLGRRRLGRLVDLLERREPNGLTWRAAIASLRESVQCRPF